MRRRRQKELSVEQTEQKIYRLLKKFDDYSERAAINQLRKGGKKERRKNKKQNRKYDPNIESVEDKLSSVGRLKISLDTKNERSLRYDFKEAVRQAECALYSSGVLHHTFLVYLNSSLSLKLYQYFIDNYPCEEVRPGTLKLKKK